MDPEDFERLVEQAIGKLPPQYLKKLDNIEVVIEDWPAQELLDKLEIGGRGLLFGLYQGTPQTKRTRGTIFPDKITVFAGPILLVSRNPDQVKQRVESVVRHEIAHHFGLDEARIRKTGH